MGIYVVAHIRRPNVAAAHTYYVKMHIHLIDLPKTKSPSWAELNFDLPYYRMRFLVTDSWGGWGTLPFFSLLSLGLRVHLW